MDNPVATTERFAVLRIVSIYAIAGGLWIYLSDTVMGWMIHDPAIMTRIAVFKGWLFIVLTASLLYFLISRYISRLKKAEQALRESDERLRAIVSTVPVVIYEFIQSTTARSFSFVGDKLEELAGIPAHVMMDDALSFFSLIHPDDYDATIEASDRAVYTRTPFSKEFRIIKPDGSTRWIQAASLPNEGDETKSVWCGYLQDITERKQAEQSLRESEEDLKTVLELMPVGVGWSNRDGKIEYVNRNFVERFGYSRAEVSTVEEWFARAYPDPSYRQSVADNWNVDTAAAHAHGTPIPSREARITCKDGTIRHVIISTQLVRNRTIVIFTDITERENSRTELIKTQKLESLGVLAGGIAHDFNNVLTGILGNISYAQMFLDASHKSAKALREAERASKRAAELAHQLLTFAKGGHPITKAVSARHLIEESVSLVLRGSNVKEILEIPDNVRAIKVDAGQISQAFNNLIINAVQAMPGGGTITIRAKDIELNGKNRVGLASGKYVAFSFTDEGCGIPLEEQKKIFDPYFTTKSGGSGLGLASVYSIVSKHGGYVGIRSQVGTGTTFEIYLPSSDEIATPPDMDMTTPQAAPYEGSSVLVMDDEEIIRDLAGDMLAELGYRVTTCSDGREAVSLYKAAKAAGAPFSVVIMDLTIPGGMGGKEAARQILAIDPEARLIVSSGYSNDPVLSEYKIHGFCATMVKPYRITEVAQILSRFVSTPPADTV
jgi:two-component system cell cycle sensor histidine kinase/response regulator CckA